MVKVSNNLKKIRKQKGITQEELALKINVTRQAVSNWENNKSLPDIHSLQAISEALGVELEELDYGKKKNEISTEQIQDGKERLFKVILAVFGGLFVATGLFLLLTGFWEDIPAIVRTPLSLIPFCITSIFTAFVLLKKADKAYLRESSSFLCVAGFILSFYLINNLFETVFTQDIFLFICILFNAVILYITNSVSTLFLFYVLIPIFEGITLFDNSAFAFAVIPLFAAGTVFTVLTGKAGKEKEHSFTSWITVIEFCVLIFIFEFWYQWYSFSLFNMALLAATVYILKDNGLITSEPMKVFGLIFALLLLVWSDESMRFVDAETADVVTFIVSLSLFVGATVFMKLKGKLSKYDFLFAIVLLTKTVFHLICDNVPVIHRTIFKGGYYYEGIEKELFIYVIITQLFLIGIDFIFVYSGTKELDLLKINIGVLAAYADILLISNAYFDMNIGVFGLICIAFGISIFFINFFMLIKKRKALKEAADSEE